jgi:hypothetical protein
MNKILSIALAVSSLAMVNMPVFALKTTTPAAKVPGISRTNLKANKASQNRSISKIKSAGVVSMKKVK